MFIISTTLEVLWLITCACVTSPELQVTMLPAKTEWIEILTDGVWFRSLSSDTEEGSGDNRSQVRTNTFELKAYGKDAEAHVDGWITKVCCTALTTPCFSLKCF